MTYDKEVTALLLIDPYNDFISEGDKLWDRLKRVAEANECVPHMMQVLDAAWKAQLRVFYALHHRYRQGDYETWKYIAPVQKAAWSHKTSNTARGVARSTASSRLNPCLFRWLAAEKYGCLSRTRDWHLSFIFETAMGRPGNFSCLNAKTERLSFSIVRKLSTVACKVGNGKGKASGREALAKLEGKV